MSSEQLQFHGHGRDHWLHLRTRGDDEERWEAIDAIRHVCAPTDSVPLFLDTIAHDTYERARSLAIHALFDLAIDHFEGSGMHEWRPQIVKACHEASAEDREQLQEVLDLLNSTNPLPQREG